MNLLSILKKSVFYQLYPCHLCSNHIKALSNWNTDDTDTTDFHRLNYKIKNPQ